MSAFQGEPAAVFQNEATAFLHSQGWSNALQHTLLTSCQRLPMRFFIVDDSGSMAAGDGHQIVGHGSSRRIVSCSRWTELGDCIRFHANFAHAAGVPTEFRLLNGLRPVVIGQREVPGLSETELRGLLLCMDNSPNGGTPLCQHITEVISQISLIAPQLRANGQQATVIIATDGESSDGDMLVAMAPLKTLPVQVIVKLCTDDDRISSYWNSIDSELELGLDIIDDLEGESREVQEHNPWLVYGEPLHRLREWGVGIKEFDLLDEVKLSSEQMRAICAYVLAGGNPRELPHPDAEWHQFESRMSDLVASNPRTWNPVSGKEEGWINMSKLKKTYHHSEGGCVLC